MTWLLVQLSNIGGLGLGMGILGLDGSYHGNTVVCPILYFSSDKSRCSSEDVAVGGVVIQPQHLHTVLAALHSRRSDSIGAPKVMQAMPVPGAKRL